MRLKPEQMTLVNTHELKNGDIVRDHGSTFRLRDRVVHKDLRGAGGGDTIVFHADFLYWDPYGIPRHWVNTWTLQGNGLARWCKVTDPVVLTELEGMPVLVF